MKWNINKFKYNLTNKAHLNLREEYLPYKRIIGEIILDVTINYIYIIINFNILKFTIKFILYY